MYYPTAKVSIQKKYMICALEELKKCKLCNHRRKNLISVVSKENKSITKEDIFNLIRRLVLLEIME